MSQNRQSANDRRAEQFTELYSACERRLYAYIVALIGNPPDANDLLQETSLVLWQKFDQFHPGTSFLAWAREVARLRVLRYRRMHANPDLLLQTDAIEALARHADQPAASLSQSYGETLAGCVNTLNDGDRELIQLRYSSGFSVQAIAERLNRSVNAVSHSLGRIRRILRACVEKASQRNNAEREAAE